MTGQRETGQRGEPNACCRRELLDLADALVPTPEQDPFIRVLRARANGPRFAHLDDVGDWTPFDTPAGWEWRREGKTVHFRPIDGATVDHVPTFTLPPAVRDTSRDWSREPSAGELGIADPPQLTGDDYPEDQTGRDPHCGVSHPHSPYSTCPGGLA